MGRRRRPGAAPFSVGESRSSRSSREWKPAGGEVKRNTTADLPDFFGHHDDVSLPALDDFEAGRCAAAAGAAKTIDDTSVNALASKGDLRCHTGATWARPQPAPVDDQRDSELVDLMGVEVVSPARPRGDASARQVGIDQVPARPKADAAWLMSQRGGNSSCRVLVSPVGIDLVQPSGKREGARLMTTGRTCFSGCLFCGATNCPICRGMSPPRKPVRSRGRLAGGQARRVASRVTRSLSRSCARSRLGCPRCSPPGALDAATPPTAAAAAGSTGAPAPPDTPRPSMVVQSRVPYRHPVVALKRSIILPSPETEPPTIF